MSAGFSLGQGVRRAVQLVPQGVAVIDGEHRFTWREFADRTARLAAVFQGHGLKPGGRVALLALNNHWVLECFYAAVHAGGVIVPINFRLSNLELAAQLADCAPEMLILGDGFTHLADDLRQAVPGLHTVFCLGDGAMADGLVSLGEALANAHPAPDAGRSGDDVACLYYTGGTTNAAKGVMITHLNIATNNAHVFPALEFDHHTVHLHHGPLFHTAAGARLFTVTQAAGTHVFLPRFDCGQVLDAIERLRITHTTVVPTMMRMLLDHEAITTTDFSSLRFISYGGAPMPESLMREAVERLPHVKFVQSYGMTELSPVVTMLGWRDHLLEAWGKQRLRSVGRAVLYAEVAVVDDRGQSVPSGERGEIVAKGPMVMKGYWNRPELTASTIRDGWLHTGDIRLSRRRWVSVPGRSQEGHDHIGW